MKYLRQTMGERFFISTIYVLIILVTCVTLYPFVYLISISISDSQWVLNGNIVFLPHGFNLVAYQIFLADRMVPRAFLNSVIYTSVGTVLGLLVNSLAGYAASIRVYRHRKQVMIFFVFTMFFGGGMIPTYLVISSLGMRNTIWPLVLPGSLSVYYLLVFRTFFQDVSESLREAAYIEGAGEWSIFWRIIVPVSKPIFATIALFYIVHQWNAYFTPMIYLSKQELYPIQMILQTKLSAAYANKAPGSVSQELYAKVPIQSLRAAAILVTAFPIICVYPFVQKYFIKGMMIGAVKG